VNTQDEDKPFGEVTNIEQWYFNQLKQIKKEKEWVMRDECPCHHGLKGYEDTPKCADNNGDISSCVKCWNEVIK